MVLHRAPLTLLFWGPLLAFLTAQPNTHHSITLVWAHSEPTLYIHRHTKHISTLPPLLFHWLQLTAAEANGPVAVSEPIMWESDAAIKYITGLRLGSGEYKGAVGGANIRY